MQAMVEAVAMVDMVGKLDVEVTMTMAVEIAQKHIQVKQNSRVHVRCSKITSSTAQITIKLTIMPPH